MPNNGLPVYAFTIRHGGLARQLLSDTTISYNGKSIVVRSIWDTGATNSCISMDVVSSLSLTPTGKSVINTPAGPKEVSTYLVDVSLSENVNIPDLRVCDSDIGEQNVGMLIGMDIIAQGDFSISNLDKKTVFSFRIPSIQLTDYVKQSQAKSVIGPTHGQGKRKRKR